MSTRQRIVLLVLLLFGVPALVTTAMLTANMKDEVLDGAQPGGVLRGDVRDEAGKAIAGVEVGAFAVGPDRKGTRIGGTRTDAMGAFAIDVPAVQGHYEVSAGGGEWIENRVDVSRLDRKGQTTTEKPLALVLEAACRLDLEFARADGRAAGSGTYEVSGVSGGGFFSGRSGVRVELAGSFQDGRLELAGLAPMRIRLLARMTSGERVDLVLDLAKGRNHHKVEL